MANEILVALETIYRISSEGATGEVHLSADAWRVLTQVNGSRPVREIAANLKADPAETLKAAEELVRLGLVVVENQTAVPVKATVNGVFFENIEKEFVKVVGPIGPILIEEEVANLGEARDNFPRDKVAELVERVSAQIEDDTHRINFQRIILQAIRNL